MTTMVTLVAAATAATNPNPNSLGVVDIYGTNNGLYTPQATWASQAQPALVLNQPLNGLLLPPSCQLDFYPLMGQAVTFRVGLWRFNRVTKTWSQPDVNNTPNIDMTGFTTTRLNDPGSAPWFIQLLNISAGAVQILSDSEKMRAV
jgi:hypothetical protein